jgi:hypothetical protein
VWRSRRAGDRVNACGGDGSERCRAHTSTRSLKQLIINSYAGRIQHTLICSTRPKVSVPSPDQAHWAFNLPPVAMALASRHLQRCLRVRPAFAAARRAPLDGARRLACSAAPEKHRIVFLGTPEASRAPMQCGAA